MLDHETVAAALRGDEEGLRREAGVNGIVCVAPELFSVFLVREEDGGQTGELGRLWPGGGGVFGVVHLPKTFRVREITHDGDQFVLTATDGRTTRGTAAQFIAGPKLLAEHVNPRYHEQLDEILLNTHLLPTRDSIMASPATGPALDGPVDEIVQLGQAMVAVERGKVWLTFDNAWPGKVTELLPHARALLARLDDLGRAGAEFLWSQMSPGTDLEPEFRTAMTPGSVSVFLTGDFEIHYEDISGTRYYMDDYWPAVHFRADGTPVDYSIEA